jgi:hypothetical protein
MTSLLLAFWSWHAALDQGDTLATYHGVFGPIDSFAAVLPRPFIPGASGFGYFGFAPVLCM